MRRSTYGWGGIGLSVLLSGGAAAQWGPHRPNSRTGELERREDLQDDVEKFFDEAVCPAMTQGGGARSGGAVGELPPLGAFAQVGSCSLRAIQFDPALDGKTASARVLWELEGLDPGSARTTERGEADLAIERQGPRWQIASFKELRHTRISRPRPAFTEVTAASGVHVPDEPLPGPLASMPTVANAGATLSGGVLVADLDGDGLDDLLVVSPRAIYRFDNLGDLRFRATQLDLRPPRGAFFSSVAGGDFDNDGDTDVVVTVFSPDHKGASSVLFRNDHGVLHRAGLLPSLLATGSAVTADFDGDGKLDLALIPYGTRGSPNDFLEATNGAPPVFLRGDGKGGFAAMRLPRGLVRRRWGLAGVAADLTGTGRAQLYMANDFGSNDLWTWQPDGGLTESAVAAGLAGPGYGMSAEVGDLNADGRLDLYVGNMFSKAGSRVIHAAAVTPEQRARLEKFASGNTLYLATGDGGYQERAEALGVNRGQWAFGSIFLDYDNDGRLDIAVADGYYTTPVRKDL